MLRGWLLAVLVGFSCLPTGAAAFPGDSAQAMVNRLGAPASGYDEPPKVNPDDLRRGSLPQARVHWMNVLYDPLQTGRTLQGVVVVLFGLDREAILNREKSGDPIEVAQWTDLHSEREIFLGQISSEQFEQLKSGMKARWTIRSLSQHNNPQRAYDLYTLQSHDGRLKAQMSYSDLETVKEFPVPPDAPKPPKLNFWIQVDLMKP
jgi:hypothetical protein